MRMILFIALFAVPFFGASALVPAEQGISVRLDSVADRAASRFWRDHRLLSLPPEEWRAKYQGEPLLFVPGEKVQVTVEIPPRQPISDGEIALLLLVSGATRVLYSGPLSPGTYGPYQLAITADFEVYQVRVRAGTRAVTKGFYGIRPWRGIEDFSEQVSTREISLAYDDCTPWDLALKELDFPPHALDPNWARASHRGKTRLDEDEWWLWTHYACGAVGMGGGQTGLFWGEFNPWIYLKLNRPGNVSGSNSDDAFTILSHAGGLSTETILPSEIYFRERIQPVLRKWAMNVSEERPGEPLTISLGEDWSIGRGIGRHFDPEILRHFVSWMNEQFGIAIQGETFDELLRNCREYPKHFDYFIARNTTIRSLELTCEAVQDIVAGSKAWDKSGESNRQLITFPEAAEFCEILSRCIAVGTCDDENSWRATGGNPLPHSLSNMVIKAFAPDHNFCVGWKGCPRNATDGEIRRWYLEPAWITAYDRRGSIRHLLTHSPPKGRENTWQFLVEVAEAPDEKIRLHDKCFQLMEAIGVEKPIGPVFVCTDWTFSDDKSGKAFRSDYYEEFLISLRRHKVPVSCAVHADHESALPADLPKLYAPRMNGPDEIRFGFKGGSVEKWFSCRASEIPDSLIADLAAQLNSATGSPVVFPPGTSMEGYAFEAKGMKFIVAEETAGRKQKGEIRVKVAAGLWNVIDIIAAELIPSRRDAEHVVFEASIGANSATVYCLFQRNSE